MKLIKAIIFISSILLSGLVNANTVDFYLENAPSDYRVLTWNNGKKTVVHDGLATRNFSVLKFSIPSEYVVRSSGGDVNISASLLKWRKSTPVAAGNPRTVKDIGYYPFTDEHGNTRYVALGHIQENANKYPNLNLNFSGEGPSQSSAIIDSNTEIPKPEPRPEVSAADLEKAAAGRRVQKPAEKEKPDVGKQPSGAQSVINELKAIKANPSRLQCASNNGNSAHCMVCNCYYESRGEAYAGQVAVNRTVITRTQRQGFPGSICGVVWYKRRGTAAFSWTLQRSKNGRRNSSSVKRCVDATAEAVNLGSWQWDHFYNPSAASPSWAPAMKRRSGSKTYGNHVFLNSGSALKKTSRKTGTTQNKTSSQGGTQ